MSETVYMYTNYYIQYSWYPFLCVLMYDLLFDNRLDEMLQKASSQDLTDSMSEAEKAIKEHNELKVCYSVWGCVYPMIC